MPIPLSEASPRKLSGYLLQNFHCHQISHAGKGSAGCETLLQDDCRASCSLVFSSEIVGISGKKKSRRCLQSWAEFTASCTEVLSHSKFPCLAREGSMHTDRAKGRNEADVTCAVPGVDPQVPCSSCSLLLDDKWSGEQRTGVPGARRREKQVYNTQGAMQRAAG